MCEYSLAAIRSRLAVEGEELVVYRFATGSLGFTSPAELELSIHQLHPRLVPCAVCIPPGTHLLLRDLPRRLRLQLGVGTSEEVVFVQLSGRVGRHRDGIRFRNNQQVLLQRLAEGQTIVVGSLASGDAAREEESEAFAESAAVLA
jgi:hypothetical protein